MDKENIHISILKYGRDNAENGVNYHDLASHIRGKGHEVSDKLLTHYFLELFAPMDPRHYAGSREARAQERGTLTVESTFRLIEYEEFKNANSSSFWATVFAIIAIIISTFATYKSIYYSEKQMGSDVSITKAQINEIKSLKYDDQSVVTKLDNIISSLGCIIKQNKSLQEQTSQKIKKANTKKNSGVEKRVSVN